MNDINSERRICQNCKKKVTIPAEEDKVLCPKCGKSVWFFYYRPIPPLEEFPHVAPESSRNILAAALGVLCIVALVSVASSTVLMIVLVVVAIVSLLFALLEHQSAFNLRRQIDDNHQMHKTATQAIERFADARRRYAYLLKTQDARIAEYEAKAAESARYAEMSQQSARTVGNRLIEDHFKWITQRITANSEQFVKKKLFFESAIQFATEAGIQIPDNEQAAALNRLEAAFLEKVEAQELKQEQRRLVKEAKEAQKLEEELKQAQLEELRIQREVEKRKAELEAAQKEGLELATELAAQLAEMQEKLIEAKGLKEKAISNAQRTKIGFVYILSNIGAFGPDVFKVGMTRRNEPEERVKELSGASVPFPFDIHAMILCTNAPALENAIHKELTVYRVNKVNMRKEFFRCDLSVIIQAAEKHHDTSITYVVEAKADEYSESQSVSTEQLLSNQEILSKVRLNSDEDE